MNVIKVSQNKKEFYLPQRPVIRESAEITKVIIVYDTSAKPNKGSVSLKKCLESVLPL